VRDDTDVSRKISFYIVHQFGIVPPPTPLSSRAMMSGAGSGARIRITMDSLFADPSRSDFDIGQVNLG
jgi:hypothetical protein